MSQQRDVNARMRAILVDWLIEVHYKFKLAHQTLFLCVHIIDRYLQVTQVARAKLQLVGVTALLIACKYEEIYPPELRDCVYITDAAYTKEEILEMERNILQDLDFQLTVPTAYHFLTRYLELLNAPALMRNIAGYYADRNLQEHSMLQYAPAHYAAAAVYAAMRHMKQYDAAFSHEHRFNSNWVSQRPVRRLIACIRSFPFLARSPSAAAAAARFPPHRRRLDPGRPRDDGPHDRRGRHGLQTSTGRCQAQVSAGEVFICL